MREIGVRTHARCEMIDITAEVAALTPPDLACGVCHVFSQHTTAGLTVNENADPDVRHDLLAKLERLVPERESFYRHGEGNSAAHLKGALVGFSVAVPVVDGRLALGTWQGIYLCEFDGPRSRRVWVCFIRAE